MCNFPFSRHYLNLLFCSSLWFTQCLIVQSFTNQPIVKSYSTETALVRVVNDLLKGSDYGEVSFLCFLDVSSTICSLVDAMGHVILCDWLSSSFWRIRKHCLSVLQTNSQCRLFSPVSETTVLNGFLMCSWTNQLIQSDPRCRHCSVWGSSRVLRCSGACTGFHQAARSGLPLFSLPAL